MKFLLPLLFILSPFLRAQSSAARPADPRKTNVVLALAGIALGDERESVTRKYGPGVFVDNEGHTGGLYYLDPNRRFLLHVVLGEGFRVEQIEFSERFTLPAGIDMNSPALISSAVTPDLATDNGLRLGSPISEVKRKVGAWSESGNPRRSFSLTFSVDAERDDRVGANYDGSFEFERGRLVVISIYDGC